MGQRLNIEIKRKSDNKILANAYYHWSAYTGSSLKLAKIILSNVWNTFRVYEDKSDTFKAIQLLQTTGAGFLEEEYEKLNKEDKKYARVGLDRNVGLISISEKGIEETRNWEEERLTIIIDFDKKDKYSKDSFERYKRVDFGVVYPISTEEIKEYYGKELENGDIDLKNDIIDFNFDLNNMNYENIDLFISNLGTIENNYGIFKVKGQLFQIIY